MRTFAQKPKAPQQTTSAKCAIAGRAHFGIGCDVNSILHLQRTIGNQAVQRMMQTHDEGLNAGLASTTSAHFGYDFCRIPIQSPTPTGGAIQTKLAINAPGDEYEQEADRIAEHVIRMPEPQLHRACACGGECPKCQTKPPGQGHERLQTKCVQVGDTAQNAAPPIVHEVLAAPGQPLDAATREFMEPRFGHNFGHVRVHADALASRSAEAVAARAYTVGSRIVLRFGEYAPETPKGQHLLAHELAHVVQQRETGGKYLAMARTLQRQTDSQDQVKDQTALQCGVRTVQLPSPGTSSNYVVLKSGPNVAEGIVFITNVGKCQVFIHGTDESGKSLNQTNPLTLDPGEYAFQFVPPPKSAMIVAVTSKVCNDDSAISYDPCAGIV